MDLSRAVSSKIAVTDQGETLSLRYCIDVTSSGMVEVTPSPENTAMLRELAAISDELFNKAVEEIMAGHINVMTIEGIALTLASSNRVQEAITLKNDWAKLTEELIVKNMALLR